jgi:hypothetical protein
MCPALFRKIRIHARGRATIIARFGVHSTSDLPSKGDASKSSVEGLGNSGRYRASTIAWPTLISP